jgi:hypothetical protein
VSNIAGCDARFCVWHHKPDEFLQSAIRHSVIAITAVWLVLPYGAAIEDRSQIEEESAMTAISQTVGFAPADFVRGRENVRTETWGHSLPSNEATDHQRARPTGLVLTE